MTGGGRTRCCENSKEAGWHESGEAQKHTEVMKRGAEDAGGSWSKEWTMICFCYLRRRGEKKMSLDKGKWVLDVLHVLACGLNC